MTVRVQDKQAVTELSRRHKTLYDGPAVEPKLKSIIRDAPQSKLSDWDIHRILRSSQSVFFDTHVEVVSVHYTVTYLRFESIARFSYIITFIARDLAVCIRNYLEKYTVYVICAQQ